MTKHPNEAWQLQMFRKTLKKRQKVALLLELLGPLGRQRCLLVTNGDNNGAINYQLRAAGGTWSWGEMEDHGIGDMSLFLGEPVHHLPLGPWPFADGTFDRVVIVDVHEHLHDVTPLNQEIARVLAPGGLAIVSTPNGEKWLPVAVLKRIVGMGPDCYGHVVQGYGIEELEEMLQEVDLQPERRGAYARFFTELAELVINFGYVKILSKKKKGPPVEKGTIAPSSHAQLQAVQKTYRLYSMIYPMVLAFSKLDALILGGSGYAVAVAARKPM